MARQKVEIQPPLAGLDRAWAVQSQPPFTLADALNVRGRSPFDDRAILGSRPGLVKAFCQQLGGGTVESFTVEFDYTKIDDTLLREEAPTTNFDVDNLKIGVGVNTNNKVDRSILHFNLTTIPTGAVSTVIISASLAVTKVDPPGPNNGGPMKLRRIIDADAGWVEAQATWNNRATATAWSVANVKGTSSPATQTGPFTTTGEVDFTMPIAAGRMTITGLAALVQDAFTSRSKHLRIMLMAADETTADDINGAFRGSEYTLVPDRPVLTVTYEVTS